MAQSVIGGLDMVLLCVGISIGVFISATYILFLDKGEAMKPKKIDMNKFDDRCKTCEHYRKFKCRGREYKSIPCLGEKKVEN